MYINPIRTIAYDIRLLIWFVLTALVVFAFVMCVLRPARDFALARQNKKFWMILLGGGVLVMAWPYLVPLYLPFRGILQWVALIGAVYFLGPERQRMGKRSWWPRRGSGWSGRDGKGW